MSLSFNGLSGAAVTLTGAVTVPFFPSNATIRTWSEQATGSAQNTLTINTGKKGYLMAVAIGYSTISGVQVYANDGTTRRAYVTTPANGTAVLSPNCPIAEYSAGQIVKINGTSSAYVTIVVIEVDA